MNRKQIVVWLFCMAMGLFLWSYPYEDNSFIDWLQPMLFGIASGIPISNLLRNKTTEPTTKKEN